ncbi:MAG: penicillin-binding transpeptidase domain-containing protein, partial [Thermacetogeniaceae bacterium]
WLFSNFPFEVAAKTGTAESGRGDNLYHGVFVAFAPADKPEIAFAGIIESGYHGSESMGPVAKAVFEEYFGLNKNKAEQKEPKAEAAVSKPRESQGRLQGVGAESRPALPRGGAQPSGGASTVQPQQPSVSNPSAGSGQGGQQNPTSSQQPAGANPPGSGEGAAQPPG